VGERYAEVELLEQRIGECRLVGEVGLDGSPQHRSSYERQKQVFVRALAASQKHGGRVVSIHSRRASGDTIALIKEHTDPAKVLCILHWFSGSLTDAKTAVDAGCYFSVNAAMLTHDRGRALVRSIPGGRLLTETDSPFMTIDQRKSEPSDAIAVIAQLAAVYGEQLSQTWGRVLTNARKVFTFAGINVG
jgi:TatD DNase family protein